MKKSLVLAPAVAIALTGFGATAASAATTPAPTPSETTTEPAPTPSETTDAPETASRTSTDEVAAEAVMVVDPEVVEAEVAADENGGVTISLTGLEPGSSVTNTLTDEVVTADADGNAAFSVYYTGPASDLTPGRVVDFTVDVTNAAGEAQTLEGSFTIADDEDDDDQPTATPTDEETASPSPSPTATDDDDADDDWTWNGAELKEGLNLEADRVTPQKFVTDGVAFAVRGCEPGQDVTFEVSAGNNVNPYTATVSADENGIAVHGVKGLDDSQPDAYIGEYTVTATCGDNTWNDSFTVGYGDDDANPGDDDSDDNGSDDNGSDLPRTGTELTGLAAGAGLLVLGAATVLLTRRKSAKTGPADI